MEGLYFILFWVGGALLHTLYDLKVKPHFLENDKKSDEWPYA